METCRRNVGIKLVIIDHISSPSALVFPVKDIVQQLHDLGVAVLVDGAHAPGQLNLDLEDIGADFYTGNLHKWCYAPKGCAFLAVSDKFRSSLQPLVTSHLYKQDLQDQFFMQGTMDHTPYLMAKKALQFYHENGGREALVRYTTPLLDWAQQMLCHSLNTTVLPVPHSMVAPFMRVLRSVTFLSLVVYAYINFQNPNPTPDSPINPSPVSPKSFKYKVLDLTDLGLG